MKDFAAAFRQGTGEALADELLRDTDNYLAVNEEAVKRELLHALDRFLEDAARCQKEDNQPPAVYLTVSVLYTAAYLDKPQLLLELYDENWVLGKAMHTGRIDAAHLFHCWSSYKDKLVETSKGERAWIRPSHLRQMEYPAVRRLACLMATRLKYWLRHPEELDALCRLKKGDALYFTCGEYQGWQNIVAALMPDIDLFNCDPEEPTDHRTFYRCKYEDKKFHDLDLHGGRFIECTFKNCAFKNINLSDMLFQDCKLCEVTFEDCLLPGALFRAALLEQICLRRAVAVSDDPQPKEWYRPLEFSDCNLHWLRLEECRLDGCLLHGCRAEDIDIRGSGCEDSGFAPWLADVGISAKGGETP